MLLATLRYLCMTTSKYSSFSFAAEGTTRKKAAEKLSFYFLSFQELSLISLVQVENESGWYIYYVNSCLVYFSGYKASSYSVPKNGWMYVQSSHFWVIKNVQLKRVPAHSYKTVPLEVCKTKLSGLVLLAIKFPKHYSYFRRESKTRKLLVNNTEKMNGLVYYFPTS